MEKENAELFSNALKNEWNRIFLFDRAQYAFFHPYNPEDILPAVKGGVGSGNLADDFFGERIVDEVIAEDFLLCLYAGRMSFLTRTAILWRISISA